MTWLGNLIEDLIEDLPDHFDSDSETGTDIDMSDDAFPSSDLPFNDSINIPSSDSEISNQLSNYLFIELVEAIGALEDEVRKARVLRTRTHVAHALHSSMNGLSTTLAISEENSMSILLFLTGWLN
jgi:hypothetical protein